MKFSTGDQCLLKLIPPWGSKRAIEMFKIDNAKQSCACSLRVLPTGLVTRWQL
jgi:hypothetical protein